MMGKHNKPVGITHSPNWSYMPNHPSRILITDGLRSGKTNVLLNFIKHKWPDIVTGYMYLYVKDPFESKDQLLINRREKVVMKHWRDSEAFIDYSQIIDDVCENLEDLKPTKKRKMLIVFHDMITDIDANNKLSHIVTKLFIREQKFKI